MECRWPIAAALAAAVIAAADIAAVVAVAAHTFPLSDETKGFFSFSLRSVKLETGV